MQCSNCFANNNNGLKGRRMATFVLLLLNIIFIIGTSRAGASPAFVSTTSTIGRSSVALARRKGSSFATRGSAHDDHADDESFNHLAFLFSPGHHANRATSTNIVGGAATPAVQTTTATSTFRHDRIRRSRRRRLLVVEENQQLFNNNDDETVVRYCSMAKTLFRGAALRIASDLTGGTPLENIKTRTTLRSTETPFDATYNIVRDYGLLGLWKGSPSRTVEGALIGAVFMLTSGLTKTQLKKVVGMSPTLAALAGGLVGGVAQATIMTPAGLIFTALNSQKQSGGSSSNNNNKNNNNHQTESSLDIVRRVIKDRGIAGMYAGIRPMSLRQATNWASRAGFTEITRSVLGWSKYGMIGELASGVVGGVGSCWNTPIETIRVYTQRDVNQGKVAKPMSTYWQEIVKKDGYAGLFRGYTPRAVQAIWQTVFLIVVPNIMGI